MSDEIGKILSRNGWKLRRQKTHYVWACPCGEHLTTYAKTASDKRAYANIIAELRRLCCPSLAEELPPPSRETVPNAPRRKSRYKPTPEVKERDTEPESRPYRAPVPIDCTLGGREESSALDKVKSQNQEAAKVAAAAYKKKQKFRPKPVASSSFSMDSVFCDALDSLEFGEEECQGSDASRIQRGA